VRRPAFALVAALTLVLALANAGCGSSKTTDASARASARKQARLDRELHRLERKVKRKRAALRAQRARRERRAHTQPHSTSFGGGGFASLERRLGGQVGVVIGAPGSSDVYSAGSLQSDSAWSTSKVPIVLRVLQDVGGPSGLSSSQADEIHRALTLSDNEAAAQLFADLERRHGGINGAASAVDEVLRQAGDATTHLSTQGRNGFSPYGQTNWSLQLQQQFMSRLAAGCISTPASRAYVLNLMGQVTSDTWGLGSVGLPAKWKGGWGPGVDGRYLVRQMGILYVGSREAVVALAAIPTNGEFATAENMATALAQWLAGHAQRFAAAPGGC
jgi:hypothetical protein